MIVFLSSDNVSKLNATLFTSRRWLTIQKFCNTRPFPAKEHRLLVWSYNQSSSSTLYYPSWLIVLFDLKWTFCNLLTILFPDQLASGVADADTTPGFRRVDRRLAILFEEITDGDAEVEVEAWELSISDLMNCPFGYDVFAYDHTAEDVDDGGG